MSENQLERTFIKNCKRMSLEELGKYISNCLDKIKKLTLQVTPNDSAIYDELIKLMESKILDGDIQEVVRNLFIKNDEQKKCELHKLNKKFDNPQKQLNEFQKQFKELIRSGVKKNE